MKRVPYEANNPPQDSSLPRTSMADVARPWDLALVETVSDGKL
jgi:hypothetical protein